MGKDIEEAQAQIQARMREAAQMEPASRAPAIDAHGKPRQIRLASRSLVVAGSASAAQSPPPRAPARTAHSAVNRRRRDERIQQENGAFLKRLESVKSSFTPRVS